MDEWETIEIDPDECGHSEVRDYEYDTGCYNLYCLLCSCYCAYGELEQGCPLGFRYRIIEETLSEGGDGNERKS